MKKSFYILMIPILLLQLASCKKSLEVDPVSTITNASFWKTPDDVRGAVTGMYSKLRVDMNNNIFIWGEGRSGDFGAGLAGTLGYDAYYNNFLDRSNPGPNWAGLYSTINAANLLLKYAPGINYTVEADKNTALAQAYTMRAYCYFLLVRTFGGVPMRLEATENYDPASIQKPKATVTEVFTLIKSDLSNAVKLYADNQFQAGRNTWTKPAANTLKADVYLWTAKVLKGGEKDLDTALLALNDVQQSDVQLLPEYSAVFNYEQKGNKEMIMAVHYAVLESSSNFYQNMYYHGSNITPVLSEAERAFIGPVGGGSVNSLQVAKFIRDQFTTDDQRRDGTFHESYTTDGKFYGSIATKARGVVQDGVRFFMDDIPLYRYADVLLMKAEAENALGMDPTKEINMVRQRAYGTNFAAHTFVSGSKEQKDVAILQERMFEFTGECKRWWDLIRFDKVFDLVPSLQNKKGQTDLLLFPIGDDVRSREPLVTENPGW